MLCMSNVLLVKKINKNDTFKKKTISLMTYLVFLFTFPTDNKYEEQLTFN